MKVVGFLWSILLLMDSKLMVEGARPSSGINSKDKPSPIRDKKSSSRSTVNLVLPPNVFVQEDAQINSVSNEEKLDDESSSDSDSESTKGDSESDPVLLAIKDLKKATMENSHQIELFREQLKLHQSAISTSAQAEDVSGFTFQSAPPANNLAFSRLLMPSPTSSFWQDPLAQQQQQALSNQILLQQQQQALAAATALLQQQQNQQKPLGFLQGMPATRLQNALSHGSQSIMQNAAVPANSMQYLPGANVNTYGSLGGAHLGLFGWRKDDSVKV